MAREPITLVIARTQSYWSHFKKSWWQARIVIASEMGGGWGHVLPLGSFAREFINCGCEVVALCRDAKKARYIFSGMGIDVEQSPEWPLRKTGFSVNFAQCIWGNGYRDSGMFLAHLEWWTERFRTLRPDFVLADYAPTALLAAMFLHIPRGATGTGFTLPPHTAPLPSLHPWLNLSEEALTRADELIVATIKKAIPAVDSAAGIFHGVKRFLTIFPETDHFECRPSERFWGPVFEKATDAECIWPDGDGRRVFIYLSADNRCLHDLTSHIRKLGLPAIGHIRGLPDSDRMAMESATLRLSGSLLNLERAAAECDIAVTQGGYHTTASMLLSGVPLLICPEQLEQTLLAYRLEKQGLCEFVSFFSDSQKVRERFDAVASSANLERNAAAFATRHRGYDSAETVREIVRTCLDAT